MQRVWLTDTTPPVLISAEENRSVTCDAYGNNQGGIMITASDDCGNVNITFEDAALSGGCVTPVGRFERTYTIADDCGNSIQFTQFLLLTDDTPPELSITCPSDTTILSDTYCEHDRSPEALGYPSHIATDNCELSDDLYVTKTYEDGPDQLICEGQFSFTRTWTVFVLDHCYNHAVKTCTQEITVADTYAPAVPGIVCPDDITLNVDADCNVNTMPDATGTATAATLDNCDSSPEIFIEFQDGPYEYSCEPDAGSAFDLTASLGALESATASLEDDITAVGISIDLDWSSDGCTEWPLRFFLPAFRIDGKGLCIAVPEGVQLFRNVEFSAPDCQRKQGNPSLVHYVLRVRFKIIIRKELLYVFVSSGVHRNMSGRSAHGVLLVDVTAVLYQKPKRRRRILA